MEFRKCNFGSIENQVETYYESNKITVDSYWEDHVLKSNHYQIIVEDQVVGFFAIFESTMLTLFHMNDNYAQFGQIAFEKVKRYEQVTNAFIPTGDEFFLSHAIDNFARLEKQAYFSIYREEELSPERRKDLVFKRILTQEDIELFALTKDFFEVDSADKILSGTQYFRVYKVEEKNELVGFGVVEYGRVVKSIASTGMYVMEDKREQGYAANILKGLQNIVKAEGFSCRSGCWYYNHNSLKSMYSAGAYSKTRLLRFYF